MCLRCATNGDCSVAVEKMSSECQLQYAISVRFGVCALLLTPDF